MSMAPAQMDPSNLYSAPAPPPAPLHPQPAYPMHPYPPEPSLGSQAPVFPQADLDRQMVFAPYAVADPVVSQLGMNNISWDLSMNAMGPGSMDEATNALFIPFNLQTPQFEGDGLDCGGTGFAANNVGMNDYMQSVPNLEHMNMSNEHGHPGMGGPGLG